MGKSGNGKRPPGRPTLYSEALSEAICSRLAEGESLRSICRDPEIPHVGTICRWLSEPQHASFREQYARAREAQAEAIAEEAFELADSMLGASRDDSAAVNAARLAVDTRKWFLARMSPKRYGDRVHQEVSYPDGIPAPERPEVDNSPEAIRATHAALEEAGYFEDPPPLEERH